MLLIRQRWLTGTAGGRWWTASTHGRCIDGVEGLLKKWKTFRSSAVKRVRYVHFSFIRISCIGKSALSWRLRLKLFYCVSHRNYVIRPWLIQCSDAYRHSVFSRGFRFSYSFLWWNNLLGLELVDVYIQLIDIWGVPGVRWCIIIYDVYYTRASEKEWEYE